MLRQSQYRRIVPGRDKPLELRGRIRRVAEHTSAVEDALRKQYDVPGDIAKHIVALAVTNHRSTWHTLSTGQKILLALSFAGLLTSEITPTRVGITDATPADPFDRARAEGELTPVQVSVLRLHRHLLNEVYRELSVSDGFTTPDLQIGETVLTPGDHIYRNKVSGIRGLQHHGVYVGRGLVVEIGQPCLKQGDPGQAITATTIDDFIQIQTPDEPYEVFLIRYQDRKPRNITIREAIDSLGPWRYNVFFSNCEHFATRMASGQWESAQITKLVNSLEVLAGSVIIKFLVARSKDLKEIYDRVATATKRWIRETVLSRGCSVSVSECAPPSLAKVSVESDRRGGLTVVLKCGEAETCYRLDDLLRHLEQTNSQADPLTGYPLSDRQLTYLFSLAYR